MTKSQTHAEVFYSPQRKGFLWRIHHVPGRFITTLPVNRRPIKTEQAARDSLDTAIGLLRLDIPESQIKSVPRKDAKPDAQAPEIR